MEKKEKKEKDQGPHNNLKLFFSETLVILDCVLLSPELCRFYIVFSGGFNQCSAPFSNMQPPDASAYTAIPFTPNYGG